jgi:O-antigen/teichoic acid export membrane protein
MGELTLPLAPAVTAEAPSDGSAAARQHIRGSALLLGGRFISVLLNFAIQVLTVRYLAKHDYGAFAYALGVTSIAATAALSGLGKAIPRLVPIYEEQRNYPRMFGSIVLAAATIFGLGLSLVVLLHGMRAVVGERMVTDPQAMSLLLILIALAPLDAFDNFLQHLVAVFAGARAIFLRRQVLGPGLKLVAVLVVILSAGDVSMLAYGYVAGGLVGVWLYIPVLIRAWRKRGVLQHLRLSRLELPAKELFGLSVPLLSSELSLIVRGAMVLVILEYFRSTEAVAEYRAVLPVAGLNAVAYDAFGFLFVPLASRMFARGDHGGINDLYWQTSLWIAVLSFPVLAVTCSLATPITILLFGQRYAEAGTLLAILAVGHYFSAAIGFNAATLRVYGNVRLIVGSEVLTAATSVVLSIVLIGRYGALGAAIGTTTALILQNIFNLVALRVGRTGIRLLEWKFLRIYAVIVLLAGALLSITSLLNPPVYLTVALAAVASLLLVRLSRHVVSPEAMFPELLRIPLMRQLLT